MGEYNRSVEKVCNLLDKLTLDGLLLMEEKVKFALNTENAMCAGEIHLAKARYIMGQNNVSSLQLPTENSRQFTALAKVYTESNDKSLGQTYHLHLTEKLEDRTIADPIKWFGVLVPQNLNYAQNIFRQALQWAVQAINAQTQLQITIMKICQLKDLKITALSKQ